MINKNDMLNYIMVALFVSIIIIVLIIGFIPKETPKDVKKIRLYTRIFIGLFVSLLSLIFNRNSLSLLLGTGRLTFENCMLTIIMTTFFTYFA